MDKQQSRREALAKRVYGMCWPQEAGWPTWCGAHEVAQRRAESVADFILAEQERREGPLVEALDKAIQCAKCQYEMRTKEAPDSPPRSLFWELDTVLATYRALDAPPAPEPSLAEVVAPVLARACHERDCPSACPRSIPEVCTCGLKEARAALAREREKGAGK